MRWILLFALLAGIVVPGGLEARGRSSRPDHLGIGANVGWYSIGGEDLEGTNDGPGIEIYAGGGTGNRLGFDLNVGFHFSRHDLDIRSWHVDVYGVYLEPRFVYGRYSGRLSPFVGARLAWIGRYAESKGGAAYDSDGYAVGALGGLVMSVVGRLTVEASISATRLSFAPIFGGGSSGNDLGTSVGFQLGVAIPFFREGD